MDWLLAQNVRRKLLIFLHDLLTDSFFFSIVLVIMYIMYPVTYPTACALDYFLGKSHGTIYKKAGLFEHD